MQRQRRRRTRWWPVVVVVMVLLGCGGLAAVFQHSDQTCHHQLRHKLRAVHTERRPIARELAPLGGVVQVHWIQDPLNTCDWLPVPGAFEIDREGVAELTPAAATVLQGAYHWDGSATAVVEGDPRLTAWIPRGSWAGSDEADARFGPRVREWESCWYKFDIEHHVVHFFSTIHGSTAEGR